MKYNVGGGLVKLKGFINLDKNDLDLDKPFKLDDCEYVLVDNVLEHLINEKEVMANLHDTLNDDGICKVVLPVFNPSINHKSFIHTDSYFNSICGVYTDDSSLEKNHLFIIKSKKFIYNDFRHIIYRLYKFFQMVFVKEIEFELLKNNDIEFTTDGKISAHKYCKTCGFCIDCGDCQCKGVEK